MTCQHIESGYYFPHSINIVVTSKVPLLHVRNTRGGRVSALLVEIKSGALGGKS